MLGDNIKKLRTDNFLTQKDLADKLFVTAQAVSRWENGDVEPSIGTIKEMAKIFNVSADEIIGIPLKKYKPETVKKEYVYKELPKQAIATCEICNKLIYDEDDIVRWTTGRHRRGNVSETNHVCCKKCDQEKKDKIKNENIQEAEKRRTAAFIASPIIAITIMIIGLTMGLVKGDNKIIIYGVIGTILSFTLVSCLILNNNFVGGI